MDVTGKIRVKGVQQQVSASFVKSELVITTEEQYPQHILIEFHQDKVDLFDPYQVGELVKVSINLRGREWINPQGEARYFNSLQGWKVERATTQQPQQAATPQNNTPAPPQEEEDDDDLPF
jgi:hypothetical protein